MKKSILLGTKEDVTKRCAKQATAQSMPATGYNRTHDGKPKQYIVTFNHPCIK